MHDLYQQAFQDTPAALSGPVARHETCAPAVSTASSDARGPVLEQDPCRGAQLATFLYLMAPLASYEQSTTSMV